MSITVEDIASVCHEANRTVCEAYGDHSQSSWKDAAQWQRDSAVEGVRTLIKDSATTPSALHDAWCKNKYDNGWVYGPVKDAQAKTHPCLAPYETLPVEQRVKDYVFMTIALSLLSLSLRESCHFD